MVLDALPKISEGVVTVAQVAIGSSLLFGAWLSPSLLQRGELLFKVDNGLLEVGEVHPGDAHVAQRLRLRRQILQLLSAVELLLETPGTWSSWLV